MPIAEIGINIYASLFVIEYFRRYVLNLKYNKIHVILINIIIKYLASISSNEDDDVNHSVIE